MLSFLPLIKNNLVTMGLKLAWISYIISSNTIKPFFFVGLCSLLNFHKHHQLFVNNQ